MENQFTFKAEYFLHGEYSQSQIYSKTGSDRVISIHQESIFRQNDEKDFKFESSFTINPDGYSRTEIKFTKQGELTTFRVRRIDVDKLEIYHNSIFKEIIETNSGEIILFDDPNPAFDYFNYMYFVNSSEGEEVKKTVYFLDWFNGKALKKDYSFIKNGNKVYIKKNNNMNGDSEIEFWDDSYNLKKIISNNSVYFFNF